MAEFKETKYIRDSGGNLWIMNIVFKDELIAKRFDIFCNHKANSYGIINHSIHLIETTGDLYFKTCHIDNIIVSENSRRCGIGSWMLSETMHFWQARGITKMTGNFVPREEGIELQNTSGYNFWTKHKALLGDKIRVILTDSSIETGALEITQSEFNLNNELTNAQDELRECQNKMQEQLRYIQQLKNKSINVKICENLRELSVSILICPVAFISKHLIDNTFGIFKKLFKKSYK